MKAGPSLVPDSLLDVALVDATTCAATCGCSLSQWHADVRSGKGPAPAIRQPRFTRWKVADLRAYLLARVSEAAEDPATGAAVIAKAKRASEAAQAKRAGLARAERAVGVA